MGARVLARVFGAEVAGPVALHVPAKRWRCAVDPSYHRSLSEASERSLVVQGGAMDEDGCRRFAAHPGFAAAVRLREWDDAAKVRGLAVPPLGHYRPLLESLESQPRHADPVRAR